MEESRLAWRSLSEANTERLQVSSAVLSSTPSDPPNLCAAARFRTLDLAAVSTLSGTAPPVGCRRRISHRRCRGFNRRRCACWRRTLRSSLRLPVRPRRVLEAVLRAGSAVFYTAFAHGGGLPSLGLHG
jgi:hypothetical protein